METFIVFLAFLCLLSPSTLTLVRSDMNTIQSTCKNTKYYNLCVSCLISDPRSSTADAKGLAAIVVGVGLANATATASYISDGLLSSANNTALKKVLKDCSHKYTLAADALRSSLQDLDNDAYDYASMHVMGAADYPNGCRNEFRRYKGLVYPAEVRRREEGLRSICDVALGILDQLG